MPDKLTPCPNPAKLARNNNAAVRYHFMTVTFYHREFGREAERGRGRPPHNCGSVSGADVPVRSRPPGRLPCSPFHQPSTMIVRMRFSLILLTLSSALARDAGATHDEWPHYGGTQFSWRYSALDQINTSNIKSP